MRLIVRPIRYTADLRAMQSWAETLGMQTLVATDDWTVLDAGRGRLALHRVDSSDPLAGTTSLAFETDDLDALERAWSSAGLVTRRVDSVGMALLFAATPFGGEIAAGQLSPEPASASQVDPGLTVMPMLVADEVEATARRFQLWGLRPRTISDGGSWVDLRIPDDGGLLAIHSRDSLEFADPSADVHGELSVGLTFEHPDVDALLERVRASGNDRAHVVDESYNRTLLVPSPDGDTIWVNGAMDDLYGYTRAEG